MSSRNLPSPPRLAQLIAHDAISALINLSSMLEVVQRLHKLPGFVTGLVRLIVVRPILVSPRN